MALEEVLAAASKAKEAGTSRFCMGAAWRGPKDKDLDQVCEMVTEVKKTWARNVCDVRFVERGAGLDFYNHNIDTSEEFYSKTITTRTFQDRIDTLDKVCHAGLKVCCGGIIDMGEDNDDRIKMLVTLANLDAPPESVPIKKLNRMHGIVS